MRKHGLLTSWRVSGFGMVATAEHEVFFLHRSNITTGDWLTPAIGSEVEFDVAPAREGGRFQQAVNATVTAPAKVGRS